MQDGMMYRTGVKEPIEFTKDGYIIWFPEHPEEEDYEEDDYDWKDAFISTDNFIQ